MHETNRVVEKWDRFVVGERSGFQTGLGFGASAD
jgi:hypothetical protein